ncbi:Aldo/keto reductase [Lentinus brumalis]|uniref:Aldo/keto reductase n=1 Tax=Lentinus brumalis TaxID=2498619 RepID=A0A371DA25_9APHY|nr:Aldo/keto reductase [Polyporus brumalis]
MSQAVQVEYRQLGKSGLRVSVPILGGMAFGDPRWAPWMLPEEKALPILKAAWDAGINTIDTANMYSNGESERMIRLFMEKYSIPREKLVIATKVFFIVAEDPNVNTSLAHWSLATTRDYVNQGGLSRTAIFNQVEASLKRLGTSYIDLLQVHMFDAAIPIEETMKALHDLVQSGKVRYIGASNMRTWQFAEMNRVAELHGWTTFVSMQVEYSLLYRNEELEMIPYCNYKGIGVIPYAPLLTGHLARPAGTDLTDRAKALVGSPFEKKLRESDIQILRRVEEVAHKKAWSMSQVALAWIAAKVASPIVGVNKVERLHDNITSGKTLTPDEIQYLEELYEVQKPRF